MNRLQSSVAFVVSYCRDRGASLGKLALQFAVSNPDIPTHIVGTANPNRILQNIREVEEPLDEADVEQRKD